MKVLGRAGLAWACVVVAAAAAWLPLSGSAAYAATASPGGWVSALVATDTVPPVTTASIQATYTSPAQIHLSAQDVPGGTGVIGLSYKLDDAATVTVGASSLRALSAGPPITPTVPAPLGHFASGTAETNELCGNSSCHSIVALAPPITATVFAPAGHTTPGTGLPCASCHVVAVAPTIAYGTSAPAGHASLPCTSCHPVVGAPVNPIMETTVTVSAAGTHTLAYWATDQGGNVETRHTATFSVAPASVTPPTVTIARSTASVKRPTPFVLSGVLLPGAIGDPVVVYVKKPGSPRWSYSSARLCYALASPSGAKWWYRYTPLLRGTYSFYAALLVDPTHPMGAKSLTTSVSVR